MGSALHEIIDEGDDETVSPEVQDDDKDLTDIMDTGFDSPDTAAAALEYAGPTTSGRGRKSTLGPNAAPELKELFTEGGIGKVVTNGLNSMFRACGADELDDADERTTRKIVAYYFQARMPKSSTKFQPEVLLVSQLLMLFATRVEPIAKKTVPFWQRLFDRLKRKG